MPKNKLAIPRLIHFIAMLKENRYPNHPSLLREMQKLDIAGAYSITQKTLQRDVAFLKGDYRAPIEYDYQRRGYYLTNLSWTWDVPQLNDADLDATILGARLAESIMPAPIGKNIRKSLDSLLAASDCTVRDTNVLLSLVATGAGIPIKPEIFSEVYKGWQTRHVLLINYVRAIDGVAAELTVEPQVLAFHEGCWYLKVKLRHASNSLYEAKNIITLAIHRIAHVVLIPAIFEPDETILTAASQGKIFDFPKIEDIQLKLQSKGLRFAIERFSPKFLKTYKDGSQLVSIPYLEEYKIMNFVFSWPGDVVVVKPKSLRNEVQKYATQISRLHEDVSK